jgi:menaquinone-dependent protoporphyrinogen oxidase
MPASEEEIMKVLVAYASRHGATKGIADRIAQTLEPRGHEVTLRPADQVSAVAGYDAFIIGSAAYAGHWLKEARGFVRQHREFLASRPVWLFSSGPIGTDMVDAKGRDVFEASRPAEFAEFAASIHPRDERVFFGAFDPDAKPIGLMERFGAPFMRMPGVREAMPAGDFRDWPQVEAWAEGIARELTDVRTLEAAPV